MKLKTKLIIAAIVVIPGAIPATLAYLGFKALKLKIKRELDKKKYP